MSNVSNSHRILQELVSVEAWHKPLEFDNNSPFHVALGFADARYSGPDNLPIEFQVKLKRATLVVVCDQNLKVPKSTTVRVHPTWEKSYRQMQGDARDRSVSSSRHGTTDVAIDGLKGPSANASVSRGDANNESATRNIETEYTQTIRQHIQMNYRYSGDEHQWDCHPINADTLQGSAHTGSDPIMEIKPTLDKRLEDMGVRVFVKCKADDFEITDIRMNKSLRERLTGEDLQARERLAKQVIKHKLAEADLEATDLDASFREVVIADIISIPEEP